MDTTIEIEKDFDLTDTLTEIINGVETMTPAPSWIHQIISSKLYKMIDRYVDQRRLGQVNYAPLDVLFEENVNRVQPDILFIRKEKMPTVITTCVHIVPDMVLEIVSPGSYERDVYGKKALYEKYGVSEYWVVIPSFQAIEVFILDNGRYVRHSYAELEGVVTSKVIEGLTVNVKEIFE